MKMKGIKTKNDRKAEEDEGGRLYIMDRCELETLPSDQPPASLAGLPVSSFTKQYVAYSMSAADWDRAETKHVEKRTAF